jgi:hydrogenase maturation protein HypF
VTGRPRTRYEWQLALELNMAADPAEAGGYDFALHEDDLLEIDMRPAVRGAVGDLLHHRSGATISARFHNTLVAAAVATVRRIVERHGPWPIVLTGGCFQNARLAEGIARSLRGDLSVHLHRRVPPGDGGIALGQAVVASKMSS